MKQKKGYYFISDSNGSFLEEIKSTKETPFHKGTHGYSPKKENYETTLFISGPSINADARIPVARLIDEGPTFLHAMGLKFPQAVDGKVLKGLFN